MSGEAGSIDETISIIIILIKKSRSLLSRHKEECPRDAKKDPQEYLSEWLLYDGFRDS